MEFNKKNMAPNLTMLRLKPYFCLIPIMDFLSKFAVYYVSIQGDCLIKAQNNENMKINRMDIT